MAELKRKTIPIEKLTPEMILAGNIKRPNGDMIFQKSEELSESIIERFKKFGVTKVEIMWESADSIEDAEATKERLKKIEKGLDYRFRKVNHIALMKELKGIVGEHLKGGLEQ